MLYWLIYDISNDQVRNKISSACKNYGLFRAQKSSFIGKLSRNRMEMLALEIKEFGLKKHDCVFIIPSCKSCFSHKEIMGHLDEEKVKEKEFVIFGI